MGGIAMNISELCKEKGYKLSHGIDWSWIENISYEDAIHLDHVLNLNGYETRGVDSDNDRIIIAIRYR
jgi:hypothetical protein